jgi:hypothetical protein
MTLIELIAAIAVTGLVLLGALLLLDGVTAGARRMAEDAASVTAIGTTAGLLHQLLEDASPSGDSAERFAGDEQGFVCWTRCAKVEGWIARCRVSWTLVDSERGSVLRSTVANERDPTLARYGSGARLRYFDADHEAWTTAWNASATIPAAVGVVSTTDTVVYSVGPARE